jgi:hypothetical protein
VAVQVAVQVLVVLAHQDKAIMVLGRVQDYLKTKQVEEVVGQELHQQILRQTQLFPQEVWELILIQRGQLQQELAFQVIMLVVVMEHI